MKKEAFPHYVDNILTEAQARMALQDRRLLVTWYTNKANEQSVVHSHPYHELILSVGGSTIRYSAKGNVYLVQPGELIYFPAQMYHSGKFNVTDTFSERLMLQIDAALWQAARRSAALGNAPWMREGIVLERTACQTWDMEGLFARMAQTMQAPRMLADRMFEAQVSELLLLISLITGNGQTSAPSSTNVLVNRAASYLQMHYQDPALNATVLAQKLYASREHLSRAFRECTMESIHEYLTNLRMQHCRQLLASGASVLSACTESGFPDYSSFLKTFRRMYAMTPAQYRAKVR